MGVWSDVSHFLYIQKIQKHRIPKMQGILGWATGPQIGLYVYGPTRL